MGELQEIVTVEQVQGWFVWLAIAAPPVGLLAGALVGRCAGHARRGAAAGLAIGMLGPANLALWFAYNAIADYLGMDTVRNLLVNLALFAVLGGVVGFIAARVWRATAPAVGEAVSKERQQPSGKE